VFTAEEAEVWKERGEQVILVRNETSPEDIGGMDVAEGILTARGGMTSHAAVVARGMGKCCVAGCSSAQIDEANKTLTFGTTVLKEGDWVTLNGTAGEVIVGQVPMVQVEVSGNLGTLLEWADEYRALGIRTNADTPHDSQTAVEFGAEGIGLCRTEHMFFEGDRISAVRQMIFASDQAGREAALAKLLPYQKGDFKGIFKAMEGKPVTVRLLDPPLHEFVPQDQETIKKLAGEMGLTVEALKARIESLEEINPMLGHRGCRLGVTYPEIYAMQARAIFEAAAELTKEGVKVFPEVMIPLIGTVEELKLMKEVCVEVAEAVKKESGVEFSYLVGTMMEIPRACVVADEIASEAEFFSFGTNDLTQMTFGFSRDDAGTFLPDYVQKEILERDPFQTLDQVGVGYLVKLGVEKGRSVKPNLKVGVCGEHGGDPASIDFFHRVGLDYVSCSPYRVPIARLAAAQANIRNPR
jgi:pyruvate,orthophosphate dikinase